MALWRCIHTDADGPYTGHEQLVTKQAAFFARSGVPIDELMAAGYDGLQQAAASFETRLEARFETYATWWIRKAMKSTVRKPHRSEWGRAKETESGFDSRP